MLFDIGYADGLLPAWHAGKASERCRADESRAGSFVKPKGATKPAGLFRLTHPSRFHDVEGRCNDRQP